MFSSETSSQSMDGSVSRFLNPVGEIHRERENDRRTVPFIGEYIQRGQVTQLHRLWSLTQYASGFQQLRSCLLLAFRIDPRIPPGWTGYEARIRHAGGILNIRIENPDGIIAGRVELIVDGDLHPDREIEYPEDGSEKDVIVRFLE